MDLDVLHKIYHGGIVDLDVLHKIYHGGIVDLDVLHRRLLLGFKSYRRSHQQK